MRMAMQPASNLSRLPCRRKARNANKPDRTRKLKTHKRHRCSVATVGGIRLLVWQWQCAVLGLATFGRPSSVAVCQRRVPPAGATLDGTSCPLLAVPSVQIVVTGAHGRRLPNELAVRQTGSAFTEVWLCDRRCRRVTLWQHSHRTRAACSGCGTHVRQEADLSPWLVSCIAGS